MSPVHYEKTYYDEVILCSNPQKSVHGSLNPREVENQLPSLQFLLRFLSFLPCAIALHHIFIYSPPFTERLVFLISCSSQRLDWCTV